MDSKYGYNLFIEHLIEYKITVQLSHFPYKGYIY